VAGETLQHLVEAIPDVRPHGRVQCKAEGLYAGRSNLCRPEKVSLKFSFGGSPPKERALETRG
jgi:hypothetical protein